MDGLLRGPTFHPQAKTNTGWFLYSPHICLFALANLKGKPCEMFREMAKTDPLQRPQHVMDSWRVEARGRLDRTAQLISPPILMGFHHFQYHQQLFTVLSSQMLF
jgi:hypothetical protein